MFSADNEDTLLLHICFDKAVPFIVFLYIINVDVSTPFWGNVHAEVPRKTLWNLLHVYFN